MSNQNTQPTTTKINNPERIERILDKVAKSGLTLQLRAASKIDVAVKGRALQLLKSASVSEFFIGGISDKGKAHLATHSKNGLQIEFVLTAMKIIFVTEIIGPFGTGIKVSIPDTLISVERRKDTRFPVIAGTRGFLKFDQWQPAQNDPTVLPFFSFQRQAANCLQIGDVSQGGLSVVSRFPSACTLLPKGSQIEKVKLLLPLLAPIPVSLEVRWTKILRESVQDLEGNQRTFSIYRFGIQFTHQAESLKNELQRFMSKLAVAEAI